MQQDEGEDYGGGEYNINNDSVIDINNNNYYNDNNDVPPLGARIIPLERQMEISKELSEKHNYYQYYDNRSD
ncbi:11741_t:CDS:2 [Entrophospora sp. SA101]|nr:11741_t:CDS:2 [Entrophospora sp. SA101]